MRENVSNLIVKSNSLIEASFNLSVVEFRILQIIFVQISKFENSDGVFSGREFRVYASDYMRCFGVDRATAYESLKEASERLFNRYFTYERVYVKPDFVEIVKSRWAQKVGYAESQGYISIHLSDDVVDLVGKLKDKFTRYQISKISGLSSIYALRLYEMIIQWGSTKKTPIFEIKAFRERLGLGVNEYLRMYDFKNRVLDVAIKQINEKTDITTKYQQHKQGRAISGFSFTFRYKTKPKDIIVGNTVINETYIKRHKLDNESFKGAKGRLIKEAENQLELKLNGAHDQEIKKLNNQEDDKPIKPISIRDILSNLSNNEG